MSGGMNISLVSRGEYDELLREVEQQTADYDESLDTLWVLSTMTLVFFMHAGFSMLEAGSVRVKNTQNILAKSLVVLVVGFLSWWVVGWPLAFEAPKQETRFIGGGVGFFMDIFFQDRTKFQMFKMWLYQGTFCATAATIAGGAMAERTKLKGFGIYTLAVTCLIYPTVVYWVWSRRGFLNYTGSDGRQVSIFGPPFVDFAGGAVVHIVGGTGALVGAAIVGPRRGRFTQADQSEFDAHNVPFCAMGTFFLFFGWYGFNAGSTGAMHDTGAAATAGLVAVNTTLSACVAGLLVFFLRARVFEPRRLDIPGYCNGILAGLVAVTAGCATVQPWEAVIIGAVAGLAYQGCSMLLRRFHIDDVVDAVPVHLVNGTWGTIAAGLFGGPVVGGNGSFYYGGAQLGTQLIGTLIILAWCGSLSLVILLPLRVVGWLRLSDRFQHKGADVMEHSPSKAYNEKAGEDGGECPQTV